MYLLCVGSVERVCCFWLQGVHQLVGIVCISLVVLQPVYGFLRPENGPSLK